MTLQGAGRCKPSLSALAHNKDMHVMADTASCRSVASVCCEAAVLSAVWCKVSIERAACRPSSLTTSLVGPEQRLTSAVGACRPVLMLPQSHERGYSASTNSSYCQLQSYCALLSQHTNINNTKISGRTRCVQTSAAACCSDRYLRDLASERLIVSSAQTASTVFVSQRALALPYYYASPHCPIYSWRRMIVQCITVQCAPLVA